MKAGSKVVLTATRKKRSYERGEHGIKNERSDRTRTERNDRTTASSFDVQDDVRRATEMGALLEGDTEDVWDGDGCGGLVMIR